MYYIHILFVITNKTPPKLKPFGVYRLLYHAYEDRILIADNFEMLVRAMGTGQYAVWNGKESEFISMIRESVNAKGVEFWQSFVGYYK